MLLEQVRDGFTELDRGEIDEFDLDDFVHRYERAAADLWKFCGSSGGQWLQAANMLTYHASKEKSRTGGRAARSVATVIPEHPTPDASISERRLDIQTPG